MAKIREPTYVYHILGLNSTTKAFNNMLAVIEEHAPLMWQAGAEATILLSTSHSHHA